MILPNALNHWYFSRRSLKRKPFWGASVNILKSGTIRVLSVDDDQIAQKTLSSVMKAIGFEVITCLSATQAIDWLMVSPKPDIVLLDVGLPDMNGVEVAKVLRSMSDLSDVPILMVSGFNEKGTIVDGLNAGVTDYIIKV